MRGGVLHATGRQGPLSFLRGVRSLRNAVVKGEEGRLGELCRLRVLALQGHVSAAERVVPDVCQDRRGGVAAVTFDSESRVCYAPFIFFVLFCLDCVRALAFFFRVHFCLIFIESAAPFHPQ